MVYWLVLTGTMESWNFYDFPESVGNGIIIPTDFHSIIFRGVDIPPTSTYTHKYGLASGKHAKNSGKSPF